MSFVFFYLPYVYSLSKAYDWCNYFSLKSLQITKLQNKNGYILRYPNYVLLNTLVELNKYGILKHKQQCFLYLLFLFYLLSLNLTCLHC